MIATLRRREFRTRRRRLAAVAHGRAQGDDRGGAVRGVIHVVCLLRPARR
jgi:hypothetical protein